MTDYTIPMIIGMAMAFTLGAGLGALWGLSRHEWLYCRVTAHLTWRMRERGIRDGVQMMLERMTDIIAARNATHVSDQMSEASASGKLNDAFNEKNKEDWR